MNFNSHTREGVTQKSLSELIYIYFNSHTREGVTVFFIKCSSYHGNFNSHTREGVT